MYYYDYEPCMRAGICYVCLLTARCEAFLKFYMFSWVMEYPFARLCQLFFGPVIFVTDGFHIIYVGHANPESTLVGGQINATHT